MIWNRFLFFHCKRSKKWCQNGCWQSIVCIAFYGSKDFQSNIFNTVAKLFLRLIATNDKNGSSYDISGWRPTSIKHCNKNSIWEKCMMLVLWATSVLTHWPSVFLFEFDFWFTICLHQLINQILWLCWSARFFLVG